jgi:hypothetical protein
MRIERPLLKLPIRFCGDTLAREVRALPRKAWQSHPEGYDGNIAVPLVSPGGEVTNRWSGPMAPTEALGRCAYVRQIMQELDSKWGRSRLMGLEAGAVVPEHVDIHYYWRTHLRIHIPVITNPAVAFTCDGETVHMAPGECWLLDSFYRHSVRNAGEETRIHLVLDTVGSAALWDLIDAALRGGAAERFIAPGTTTTRPLQFEQINAPTIMSPWEIKAHIAYLMSWTEEDPRLESIARGLDRFVMAWSGTWAQFGTSDEGLPSYLNHLSEVEAVLATIRQPILMRNGWGFRASMRQFVLANAIDPATLRRVFPGATQVRQFA